MAENHEIVLFPPLPTLPTCSPRLRQQSPNLLSPLHLLEKQPLTTAKDERNRPSQEPKFPRLGREPRPHNKSLVPKKVETEIQINPPLTPQPVVDRRPKSAHLCQCPFEGLNQKAWFTRLAPFTPVIPRLSLLHPRSSRLTWPPLHLAVLPHLPRPVAPIVTVRGRHPYHKLVT